jgi:inhibitor of KinA sporulation pathway (predicted exonuclease)
VDFLEATCDEKKNFGPQEIIEFPSVIIDTRTFQVVSEIQLYIKPVAQPQLTKFCTELTGITQDKVNGGEPFLPSFEKYQGWLKKNELFDKKWTFLTCGDWDLLRMLPAQTKLSGVRIPKEFKSWINIKKVFSSFYNKNAAGMAGMLNILGMKLEGRHHSGIDDCKNIARIAIVSIRSGHEPNWIRNLIFFFA